MSGSMVAMLGLGVLHGINPGMGWLFAVGLGLQERDRAAVWRALPPLALGHGLAIGGAVAVASALGAVVPLSILKWTVAVVLLAFGVARLARRWHLRWVGMRVGARDLALWSLLMASAHGAGLMVLPFVLGSGGLGPAAGHHPPLASAGAAVPIDGLVATTLHASGYLVATALVAVVVYEKLGLRLLGRCWLNLDAVWGAALVVTALITPFA